MERWKEESGSLTVEAAFVFPIVCFVLLAVMYMGFYQVDKSNVGTIVHQAAEEQAVCMKELVEFEEKKSFSKHQLFYFLQSTVETENKRKGQVEEELFDKLMMGTVESVSVEADYTKVTVSATISMNIGISRIKEFFTGTPLQYSTSVTVPVHNPSEFARIYDAMGEMLDDIKGFQKVKDKLREMKG